VPHANLAPCSRLRDLADPEAVLRSLAEVDWSFETANTEYLGHDLHPYPAKFIPQIPANLISALSLPGELVWDPFGGCGTTALEALLRGRRAVSTDANALATVIAGTKCTALTPEQRDELGALRTRLRDLAASPDCGERLWQAWETTQRRVPQIPNYEDWFSEHATLELAYVADEIELIGSPQASRFARTAFSSIVVRASNQDSETRYARRDKNLRTGDVLTMFVEALGRALDAHEPLERLLGYRAASVATLNILSIEGSPAAPAPESVDLVVTSPPYANATDYHLYHRFRLFWLGSDPRALADTEIGSHLRHQRKGCGFELYSEELQAAMAAIYSRLRPGRYAAVVIGDARFDGVTRDSAEELRAVASKVGFEMIGVVERPLHQTRRSFIPAARRARAEKIVLLRRPPKRLAVTMMPPSYRMWPYEADLRRREIAAVIGVDARRPELGVTTSIDPYDIDVLRRLTFTRVVDVGQNGGTFRTWQAILENGDVDASRKDPKYVTHGIHPYKGKFYPQLAKALFGIAALSPGGRVLDPFCGSGTVLLEAQLNGLHATGIDLNPLAVHVSRAKTAVVSASTVAVDRAIREFTDRIDEDLSDEHHLAVFPPAVLPEILSWFPQPVARRLGWLKSVIEKVPVTAARIALEVLLSSIIREVSQQDPRDLRIRRRATPLDDAPVVALFRERIAVFRQRYRHFAERAVYAPNAFPDARVVQGNSGDPAAYASLADQPVDAIVTSPPYATALPYIDTDRLSILALFGTASTARAEIEEALTGSREISKSKRRLFEARIGPGLANELGSETAASVIRRVYRANLNSDAGFRRQNMAALLVRYYTDLRRVFESASPHVRPGGHIFIVIGDNRTEAGGKDVRIPTADVIAEVGATIGWRLRDRIPITVTKEDLAHSKNSITENEVLHFTTVAPTSPSKAR
jgi:DNA modification methylase